jgi:hypothetical protein
MKYLIFGIYVPPPVRLLMILALAVMVVAGVAAAIASAFSRRRK